MALPPPPAGLDLTESQVPRIMGVNIATFIIASIALILRFSCRKMMGMSIWWDDWLMIPAWVGSLIILITTLGWMVPHGLGKHIWVGKPDAAAVWAEGLFIHEICYTIIIITIKYSVLLFYYRIFKQSRIKIPIYIVWGVVTCWGTAVLLITIFQCLPVSAFWERFNPATPPERLATFKCGVNVNDFFNGNSIPNIITDAAIVVLPMPFIWGLKLPTAQKLAVSSIFIVGAFVIGVSIARFTLIIKLNLASPDITWNFVNTQIWTAVECHIAITCACLPSLKPLLTLALTRSIAKMRDPSGSNSNKYVSPKYGSQYSHKFGSRAKSSVVDNDDKYRRLDAKLPTGRVNSTDAESFTQMVKPHPVATAQYMEQEDIEMNRMGCDADINVTTEIRVQSQPRI